MRIVVDKARVRKLQNRLLSIPVDTERGVRDTLGDIGEDLLNDSLDIVPYDEGDLYSAGYISPVSRGPTGPEIEVGYRADAKNPIDKILVQHEDLSLDHPGGKRAKFLESPYLKRKQEYAARLKDAGRRALRGR